MVTKDEHPQELFDYAALSIDVYPMFSYFGSMASCGSFDVSEASGDLKRLYEKLDKVIKSQVEFSKSSAPTFFDEFSAVNDSINNNWGKYFSAYGEVYDALKRFSGGKSDTIYVSKDIATIVKKTKDVIDFIDNVEVGASLLKNKIHGKILDLKGSVGPDMRKLNEIKSELDRAFENQLDENNKSFQDYKGEVKRAGDLVKASETDINSLPLGLIKDGTAGVLIHSSEGQFRVGFGLRW